MELFCCCSHFIELFTCHARSKSYIMLTCLSVRALLESIIQHDYFWKRQPSSQSQGGSCICPCSAHLIPSLSICQGEVKTEIEVEMETKTPQQLQAIINNFWAVRDDISFTEQLYRRGELAAKLKTAMESGSSVYPFDGETL